MRSVRCPRRTSASRSKPRNWAANLSLFTLALRRLSRCYREPSPGRNRLWPIFRTNCELARSQQHGHHRCGGTQAAHAGPVPQHARRMPIDLQATRTTRRTNHDARVARRRQRPHRHRPNRCDRTRSAGARSSSARSPPRATSLSSAHFGRRTACWKPTPAKLARSADEPATQRGGVQHTGRADRTDRAARR